MQLDNTVKIAIYLSPELFRVLIEFIVTAIWSVLRTTTHIGCYPTKEFLMCQVHILQHTVPAHEHHLVALEVLQQEICFSSLENGGDAGRTMS